MMQFSLEGTTKDLSVSSWLQFAGQLYTVDVFIGFKIHEEKCSLFKKGGEV